MQTLPQQYARFKLWAAVVLSAVLLELPFPLAGPLPPWRSVFAWFALVPLLWAMSCPPRQCIHTPAAPQLSACLPCGVLWYVGNCYWIRDTMMPLRRHAALRAHAAARRFQPRPRPLLRTLRPGLALVLRATGSTRLALAAAPFFWAALELAAARITSVPWDQLGYSQVDNALVNQLAPWTGVYGISFVLVAVNALIAGGLL